MTLSTLFYSPLFYSIPLYSTLFFSTLLLYFPPLYYTFVVSSLLHSTQLQTTPLNLSPQLCTLLSSSPTLIFSVLLEYTGFFTFTITASDAAILGPPDCMEWIQHLEFQGVIFEGRLIGTYILSAYVQTLPPLKPGETRIDRFAIADQVRASVLTFITDPCHCYFLSFYLPSYYPLLLSFSPHLFTHSFIYLSTHLFVRIFFVSRYKHIRFSSSILSSLFDLHFHFNSLFISITASLFFILNYCSYLQVIHREDPYGTETISLPEGVAEGQYLVTVELAPYEKLQYPDPTSTESHQQCTDGTSDIERREKIGMTSFHGSEPKGKEEEESKSEGLSLQEEKEGEYVGQEETLKRHSSPNISIASATTASLDGDTSDSNSRAVIVKNQRGHVQEKYGITEQEGSVWVEWLVSCSTGGSISVGAMTAAAANDPDARLVRSSPCLSPSLSLTDDYPCWVESSQLDLLHLHNIFFLCPSLLLSHSISIYLSLSLSLSLCPSFILSPSFILYPSLLLSHSISISISLSLFLSPSFILYLSLSLSFSLSFFLSFSHTHTFPLSVSLHLSLSLSLTPSLCLSVSPALFICSPVILAL